MINRLPFELEAYAHPWSPQVPREYHKLFLNYHDQNVTSPQAITNPCIFHHTLNFAPFQREMIHLLMCPETQSEVKWDGLVPFSYAYKSYFYHEIQTFKL